MALAVLASAHFINTKEKMLRKGLCPLQNVQMESKFVVYFPTVEYLHETIFKLFSFLAFLECESAALSMPANLENSAVATWLEKVSFIPDPRKGNAKECSNYHTIAFISQQALENS